jgi:Flp pilus assembly protein TadD
MTPARLIAAAALAIAVIPPVEASRLAEPSVATQYVRARAADAAGMPELAAAQYAAVLSAVPGDEVIALRTYRQAITAGDRALALRAARTLATSSSLPLDGRLLLLGEAVAAKDWVAASRIADQIEREQVLNFLLPSIRAWIAFGSGRGDPLAQLDSGPAGSLGAVYAAEHRAFLLLALHRDAEAATAIRALGLQNGGRAARLWFAAANRFLEAGDKQGALAELSGEDPAVAAARVRIDAGKAIAGGVDSAARGVAQLFVRVAIDINRERTTPLALALARLASFLAPENGETWLVTSELLAAEGHYDAGLAVLGRIPVDDPFSAAARQERVQLLVRKGEQEAALTEALEASARPQAGADDWTRVGDLYAALSRQAEAATAYGRALALAEADPLAKDQLWTLWLLRGGSLERAGDWVPAQAALRKALALAPEQAVVLNYLGYAQLERRENLDEAQKLIEQASRLKPEDPAITDSLGWLYFLRGDVPKAIETLERAVAGEPAEPTINEHLGDAYWTAGRKYEARYAWTAALVYAEEADAERITLKLDTGLSPAVAAP